MISTPSEETTLAQPRPRSRISRLVRPHEGGADIFGSERSFAPLIGDRFNLEGHDPGGYYIDFRVKLDRPDWPPIWLMPRDEQLHVGTVQWGLGAYERYVHGEGDQWLEAALQAGKYLISIQETGGAYDGTWLHWFPMPHTYLLPVPWASGITQGEGVSLLVRLYRATGEEEFAAAALRAMRPLQTPTDEGGLLADLGGGPFFEEYPSRPPSYVLNGAIFALWGVRDAARALGDAGASKLFERGLASLVLNLHRYDTGRWSRYDLFPHPFTNLSTGSYHLLHINQLTVLGRMSPDEELQRTRQRFASYRARRANRVEAFAQKVAFRVVVPRNAAFANRNPSMIRQRRRQSQGDSLVLCYHSISEYWPAALAVRPADFENQVAHLLRRGFEPATFSDLVHGESGGKRMAITFDDGFRSVATHAQPILGRLGAIATTFIPTALVPGEERLHWNGIEQWLGTPHEPELAPLSLRDLQGLVSAGWEVGAHSRTHPHLPVLDDAALEDELRGSRRDLEQLLGRPCLSIAYPYGDEDARVERSAAEAGFAAAATLPAGRLRGSQHAWPRIGVYRIDSPRRFRLKVTSAMRVVRRSPAWNLRHGMGSSRTLDSAGS
jgi:peptidoglycan/xylan/chitin deacetylase (PgdA/CDA1 family)